MSDTIAIVFDFDDTLVPDSTTMLLKKHGIDPVKFWTKDLEDLVQRGYDPTLGWLRLLLDNVGQDKPLGPLTNEALKQFGVSLDSHLYPGLPALFDDLNAIVKGFRTISIEYYLVSGGLQSVIEGMAMPSKYFTGVYGCQLEEAGDPPTLRYIKRAINFTEKTRYLFEINKGITPAEALLKPYLVNKEVGDDKRHVPFGQMIYVGDGLTDIPCFSLLKRYSGVPFGVFDPSNSAKAKRAFIEFIKPGRVVGMHAPKYGPDDELGSLLRAAVATLCNKIVLDRGMA
jgi:phosphoglycolate phosphatase-like HAD superfamily hydrolase